MKQLDIFWKTIQPLLHTISGDEQEKITNAYHRVCRQVDHLENQYTISIRDRASVHALLKKTSDDLIQRYQTLFEYSGTAMAVVDEDGTITLVNSFFENLLGYSHDEIENKKTIFEFIEKELRQTMISYHERRRHTENEIPNNYEAKIVTRDRKILDVVITVGLFSDKNQSIVSIVDISERKQAETELKSSEERYRLLLQNINDGVIVYDASEDRRGRILEVNDRICELTGFNREDLLTLSIRDIKTPPIPENTTGVEKTDPIAHAIFESELIKKNGDHVFVEVSSRLFNLQGRETILEIVRDITERKLLEKEMEYYTSELTERTRAIQRANSKLKLLNRINSHDINNQMTLIIGLIEVMKDEFPDPTLQQYLDMEQKATLNILEQIKFAREYQEIGIHSPVWFDVRYIVKKAAQNLPLSQITLDNRLDSVEIFADPLIEKVFYTLIEDSLRHGVKVTWISISSRMVGEDLVIIYEDDGVGVPAQYKEDIFRQKYFKHSGYGLLLSVSILDITGITMKETGEEGVGVRFEITVPSGAYRSVVPQ